MRRIILIVTAITLVAAMMGLSALSSVAQSLDTEDPVVEEDDGTLDTGDDGSLDTGDDGSLDTGDDEATDDTGDEEEPAAEPPAAEPICAPGWLQEWYQWWTPNWAWWYFWWYQWCWTPDGGWFRDYDGWQWWGPIQ